jgi:diguanylate cyclase (GGDEF)-like protein/PAS domain S-box-containing protein
MSPPPSSGHRRPLADRIDDRGERILRIAFLLLGALVLCAIVGGHATGQAEASRMAIRYLMFAVALAAYLVLRRWGVGPAVRLFLFSATSVILAQSLAVSGVRTPVLLALPAILMLSGWFLGRKEAFALGALAGAGVAAMMLLEHAGQLVAQPREILDYGWALLVVIPISSVMGVHAHGRFLGQLDLAEEGARRLQRELGARYRSEERMRATLESTPNVAIQWCERHGRVRYWNHASELLFGWTAREAVGRPIGELMLDAEGAARFVEALHEVEARGRCVGPAEYRARRKDGRDAWVSATLFAIPGEEGVPYFVCMGIDVTERKLAESALRSSNESLRLINQLSSRVHEMHDVEAILRGAIDAVVDVTRAPRVVTYMFEPDGVHLRLIASHGFDPEYERLAARVDVRTSWSGCALEQRRPLMASDIAREPRFAPAVREALLARGLRSGVVIPLVAHDAPLGCVALFYPREAPADGVAAMETFEAVARTLSMAIANARHVAHLHHQARHDQLTGLPNRAALHEAFSALAPALPGRLRPAVMLLDLDRFKEINDTLGHHIGDRLLSALSRRLAATLGSAGATTCRLGGDEFAVLLHDVDSAEEALARARAIRDALAQPFEVDGMMLKAGASIGVALYPAHGADSHALLRAADVAMYRAKTRALGVCLYDRESDTHSPERLALVTDLNDAIARGELLLHYQPKLDLRSGAVAGVEALVRWNHPRLGLLAPGQFIHLAEASEVIHAFTRAVLDQAMGDCATLRRRGLYLPVALNLSARNLVDDRCVQEIERLIGEHGLAYEDIELEITETAIMHDPTQVARLLGRLDRRGVGLAIDDFGTGYSSLAHLKRLPLDSLKVDRTFVRDMTGDEQDAAIVRSTIALAHSLGMRAIAEGVEDERTLQALRTMGCDMAQGYYIGKPMPLADLFDWLAARSTEAAIEGG